MRFFATLFLSGFGIGGEVSALSASPLKPIPTIEIQADVAPFKLFKVHDSFCEYRADFTVTGHGKGTFSLTVHPRGKFYEFDVYLKSPPENLQPQTKIQLYLLQGESVVANWAGESRVTKPEPGSNDRHRYQPTWFMEESFAEDLQKADTIGVALDRKIVFESKLPKSGAHFEKQLRLCNAKK